MELLFIYDGLSLILIFLTVILYLVSLLSIWSIEINYKLLNILLLSVIYCVIITFIVFDLFFFYIFFELVLIPMFLIIGIWGSRERKLTASFRFFFILLFVQYFFFVLLFIYS